ncbi:fibronectin type III domain-containing protein [uncultured Flavobacterium sp.]|uniref:fibronectin type III domain-containing protein n=1 Tax=uncultured Flavobacterium sp. TaxID=165435 RepID=UPI0030EB9177
MKKITIWLFALFAFTQVNAQLWTINSCSNLGTTTYGPMYSQATANSNNRTAVIYPASQLSTLNGQTLNSMYFQRSSTTGTMAGTPNFKIYLKEVTATDWGATAIDWVAETTGATLVYDSNPASAVGTDAGWKSFPFATNFIYNGTQNLAVFFEYSNTTTSSSISWNYEYTSPCADTSNNNTTKYNNNTTGTLSASLASSNYRRPLIGFDFVVSCNAPNSLITSNLGTTSVDVAWTENAIQPQNGYEYYYSTSNTAPLPATVPTGTTATGITTASLTSLMPATTYYMWVRGNCGASDKSIWAGPITFTTLCVDVAAYVENFDTTPTGTGNLPVCWSKVGTSNNVYVNTGSNSPMSPANRLYMNISATTTAYAVMPPVSNLQANTHRLKFKTYCTTANKVLSVGYFTTPGDESTYVELQPFQIPSTTVADTQEFTVIPNGVPAGVTQLVFNLVAGAFTTAYIDDVKWEVNSACVEPSALTATMITNNSATLGWTNGGPETVWDIQYGLTGFSIGSGTMVNSVTANPHVLTGLTANTSYQFYVRGVCTGPTNSSWFGPFTFKTQCDDLTEFSENFEAYATGSANPLPDCWNRLGTGFTYITTGSVSPMSPAKRLYFSASGTTPTQACAVLPGVSNLQANTHRLRFKAYATSANEFLSIGYLTDPSDLTTFIQLTEAFLPSTAASTAQEFTIVPTGIPAGVKHLAILNPGSPAGTTIAYVDDVIWEAIPACPEPTSLTSSNVTSNSAVLGWTEMGTSTTWNIEYGPVGYTQGTGGTLVSGVTTNPYTLSALTPSTVYDYYVQADCGGTAGASFWIGPHTFTTLCTAFVAPYLENFDGLALVSPYTALPLCWETQVGPDFWDVTNDVTNTGNTYSPDIGDHTTTTSNYMWIDASSNITANEMVSPLIDISGLTSPYAGFWFLSENTTNTINHTIALDVWDGSTWLNIATETGNFTGWVEVAAVVPSTVPSTTKFRIYAIANPAGTTSDYYYNDLGVDDFFVMEAPTCLAPTSLIATNITANSVDLGWTENGSSTIWDIEWGTTGFTPTGTPTIAGVTTNPYNLMGLAADTSYSFYVRADCGSTNGQSIWAGPFSFTTLISCPAPTVLTATTITSSSALLGWTDNGSATTWNVEYGPVGFTQGTGGTLVSGTTTNPYALTGLTPATTYDFYVQTDCGTTNGLSTWSGPLTFTSACVAFTAPYTEGFENAGNLPNCWTNTGTSDTWQFNNSGTGHIGNAGTITGTTTTGNYFAWVDDSGSTSPDVTLTSPLIDVSSLTLPRLTFFELSNNEGNLNAELNVSVWDGAAWNQMAMYNTNTVGGWEKKTIDLSTLTITGLIQIKFVVTEQPSDFYDDIAIDDVTIDESPSTPPVCATNFVATPDTSCGNDATVITWDTTALADGYYMTMGTTTGGNDVLDNVNIGAAPNYSHIGAPNTTYYYTITPFNASGSATSCTEQSYMTVATGCYCPSVPTSNDNSGITNVQLGTTDFPNGDVTYFDHSATSVSFAQGANSNVQISFATGYTYDTYIYIDFNDNYIFEASEIVYSGESLSTNPTVLDASFLMPTTAVLGAHKVRLVTADVLTTPDPCYSGSYGVTLDFTVNITPLLSVNGFDTASFVAYPNPVKDVLNLSYSSEIASVKVINLLGQEVISRKVNNTTSQIDMTGLTAGAYIVNVTINDIVKSIKVIKQ